MVITITGDYASRLRSYELLAEAFAFGLQAHRCMHSPLVHTPTRYLRRESSMKASSWIASLWF